MIVTTTQRPTVTGPQKGATQFNGQKRRPIRSSGPRCRTTITTDLKHRFTFFKQI